MVLKKSNSPLNSGATQKCFNRGSYRIVNEPSELTLSFTLRNLPAIYDENNPSTEHAKSLEKIYDYLGFSGPDLKQFHESANHWLWDRTTKSLSISLNNQELWQITPKFDDLLKEKSFLDGEESCAEIRVQKVKKLADRQRIYKKESCVFNSAVKKDVNNKTNKRNKAESGGRRRGLQRPHLLLAASRREDEEEDDWRAQSRKKVVEVELQEEDQIDARVLSKEISTYDYWQKRGSKSKPKQKSCVNGKKSEQYRAYNPPQLRKEIDKVFNCEEIFWMEDNHYFSDDDVVVTDNCEEYNFYACNENQNYNNNFTISSYKNPISGIKKRKSGRRERVMNTNEAQLVNVNTASSQITIKHPKGSYQVIDRPCDDVKDEESAAPSDGDFVTVDKVDVQDTNDNYNHVQEQNMFTPATETPVAFNTFDTLDTFVAVNLTFPEDIQDTMMHSLMQSNRHELFVNGCSMLVGNCFPPVFCVGLDQSTLNVENGWFLVGTSHSDMSCSSDFKWEVSLKTTTPSTRNDNARDNFLCNLHQMKVCDLPFLDLVLMAQHSVQIPSDHSVSEQDKQLSKQKKEYGHNCKITPAVCTMEEALKRLQSSYQSKEPPNSEPKTVTAGHMEIPREIVECDVCLNTCNEHGQSDTGLVTLLPCNHTFCHQCWLSHIFFHVTTGSPKISCMQTGCKEVINETALRALVPENDLAKWHRQRQERFIDTSPLCQWCPKPTCNKVSVIQEGGQHVQQFGCAVVCDCNNSYCFSCQNNPHWPTSCSQAAAYRILLYKLGGDMLDEVTCIVDLKPCPGCKYPIEKNEGCPHMTCRMCGFNFCWKCLRSTDTHRVWECHVDENSTFVTYQLHNDVVSTFPLKFLDKSLDARKRLRLIRKFDISVWLNGLNRVDCKKIKLSFERSVQQEEASLVKSRAVELATTSVTFLMESYTFLEYFYILFSFALLNKEKEDNKALEFSTKHLTDRLVFTASRLEDLVIGKSIKRLFPSVNTGLMYLTNGREILETLTNRVAAIQRRSRNVDAQPIGELDPKKYYRYK